MTYVLKNWITIRFIDKFAKVNKDIAMIVKTAENGTESLLKLLKSNYRLKYVEETDILKLLSISQNKTYPKNSYVFMEGDPVTHFYIVVSGKVELNMSNHKFTEKIFSIIGPGQLLGLPEVFNCHGIHTTNALCEEECFFAAVPKDRFRAIIWELPSLANSLLVLMGNMIGELRHELSISSAEVKVMIFLKNLASKQGVMKNGFMIIPRTMSNDKIAKFLNITRETTSRIFNSLKDDNVIEIGKDHYKILDAKKIDGVTPYYACLSSQ